MVSTTKRKFEGKQTSVSIEERRTLALEFIAHYLDRIDDHLAQLASSIENGGANAKILTDIKKALAK